MYPSPVTEEQNTATEYSVIIIICTMQCVLQTNSAQGVMYRKCAVAASRWISTNYKFSGGFHHTRIKCTCVKLIHDPTYLYTEMYTNFTNYDVRTICIRLIRAYSFQNFFFSKFQLWKNTLTSTPLTGNIFPVEKVLEGDRSFKLNK